MNYKITVNTFPNTAFDLAAWNLIHKDEPERICIKRGNKEYALVFDEDHVNLEVWSLDNQGELDHIDIVHEI